MRLESKKDQQCNCLLGFGNMAGGIENMNLLTRQDSSDTTRYASKDLPSPYSLGFLISYKNATD
jgi:hypothetical protein